MPGLKSDCCGGFMSDKTTAAAVVSNGSISDGFWSKHREGITYNHLQKFWSGLSLQARQELLRIDKQSIFEQARKDMYCSRCNGLLLEVFLQVVTYGKSLQLEGVNAQLPSNRQGCSENQNEGDLCMTIGCRDDVLDDVRDPSVHHWGGLTTSRDGTVTLMDCYLYAKSLMGLQNVFDSARSRERERELLYPDACGGGRRGWISQGIVGYGRGHGTRETCALHTTRLSVDTLDEFWLELGEETRQSLLRMKEEDFIERLMYRFDSKRFCRDCRKNVIREFKELKELKRIRREPRCTSCFCVADPSFQYEVSNDTVEVDWHQNFVDTLGTYHHFDWAVGTGEGKSDILEFENVGLSARVQASGLDLAGLNACYITLRAWKLDGRCTELSVKAHALKGQQCVHRRLVVGDGYVTITSGGTIRSFFEHAEEAEEEEDDDSMDRDGDELDRECPRPQKHAKSPELAREFLLDAATVIFKEQVEKAYREGTTRQNAHSIFVSLTLKLLEERLHIACKEILTLEKQTKLLEEEEKEKREEEERKERRKAKEREKKLRRKERIRGREQEREKKCSLDTQIAVVADVTEEESTQSFDDESNVCTNMGSLCEAGEGTLFVPESVVHEEEQIPDEYIESTAVNNSDEYVFSEYGNVGDVNDSFSEIDSSKYSYRKPKFWKECRQIDQTSKCSDRRRFAVVSGSGGMVSKSEPIYQSDGFESSWRGGLNGTNRQLRGNTSRANNRSSSKNGERLHCSYNWVNERCDLQPCSCYHNNEYRAKVSKSASDMDSSKLYYRGIRYNQVEYARESSGRTKNKFVMGNNASSRGSHYVKKVWEPMETRKYSRSNSDPDVLRSCKVEASGPVKITKSDDRSDPVQINEVNDINEPNHCVHPEAIDSDVERCVHLEGESPRHFKEAVDDEVETCDMTISSLSGTTDPSLSSNSHSASYSSCLSEGDGNISTSSNPHPESSSSSSSDSEDASEHSEGKQTSVGIQDNFNKCPGDQFSKCQDETLRTVSPNILPSKEVPVNCDYAKRNDGMVSHPQGNIIPPLQAQSIQFPMFQASPMGYYHQSPISWPVAPPSGLMPFQHPNHYVHSTPFGFGYGLNGNSQFIQYGVGSLQQFSPPINPVQVPIYQPVLQNHVVNQKEHPKISSPEIAEAKVKVEKPHQMPPLGHSSLESPEPVKGQHGSNEKVKTGNTGFSLFHFSVPAALSSGCRPDALLHKEEEIARSLSPNLQARSTEVDCGCSKMDVIEEYSLFAASNRFSFSLF